MASRDLEALVAARDREIALLRNSEEQLRLVWENSIDAMLLTDAAGTILRANAAFARLCGLQPGGLEGRHFRDCGWTDPVEAFRPYQAADGKLPVAAHFEEPLVRPDGSKVVLEAAIAPFEASGNGFVFALLRDVTARRRAETERALLEGRLADARRLESVGRLAGGVAHDFNNLLTVVAGYCDLLEREIAQESRAAQMVTQIRHAAKRAHDLTGRLLAFSRKQKTADAPLNLNALILENLPMLQRLCGDRVDVVIDLEPALGSVMGDEGQFLQVVMNLAANARDAMPEGGTLTLATAGSEDFVSLAVSDTGTGISEDAQPYIFDPFFTTKEGEGAGLGLFTVSGIVQRGGGSISVRNSVTSGRTSGTVFEILLPRARTGHVPAVPEPGNREREAAPDPGGETILVVEDRKDVRELVVSILRSCGYAVLHAASGAEALAVADAHTGPIDLLLTDVLMPEMDGRDLAARMKRARPSIRVLLMSGNFSLPSSPAAASSTDADFVPEEYIMKPFSAKALAGRVRQVIDTPRP